MNWRSFLLYIPFPFLPLLISKWWSWPTAWHREIYSIFYNNLYRKRTYIYVYETDSLCCTTETNTMISQLHVNKIFLKELKSGKKWWSLKWSLSGWRNIYIYIYIYIYIFICIFRATYVAYGSSQAKGQIGAVAAGLHQSHGNAGSKPHLWPTLQLMATLDP